jgi:hypothetical protein
MCTHGGGGRVELKCVSVVQGKSVGGGFAFQHEWEFAGCFGREAFLLVTVAGDVSEVKGGAGGAEAYCDGCAGGGGRGLGGG